MSDQAALAQSQPPESSQGNLVKDLTAGVVVFLVALPLCLGIALASEAPLFSGLLAGIVGGLIVGSLSGSHTSVAGPAAGLTAVVIAQLEAIGSFEGFLLAVMLGGILQIGLGLARAGELSSFFPSSVIKGLLAAIGVILIMKQIPHVVGHDDDPTGEMSFIQPDERNTFTELLSTFGDFHVGAAAVGFASMGLLLVWGRIGFLKRSVFPAPLAVVLLGVGLKLLFDRLTGPWTIGESHLVNIPVAESVRDVAGFLTFPDFSQFGNSAVYIGAVTIAIVASLETLLNLEAVDKLDKFRRHSPPSRELWAQGAGNVVSGLIGGLPVTSVIVRSSVNVDMDARTKLSAIFHGGLLLVSVALFPGTLNLIPLSSLAAILIFTGFKLASPKLFREMWNEGRYQFTPFIITLLAIVLSDLLIGILIGLAVSALFILNSNLRRPIRRVVETHLGGDLLHVELGSQVSFLNRAALDKLFTGAEPGSHILIDASATDYIDPDILSMIRDFKNNVGPAHNVTVSLRGFRAKYQLHDEIQFADYSTRELKDRLTPEQVLDILREGNRRFRTDQRLSRDFSRLVDMTAKEQNPMAVVVGCIDSRVPVEVVFDTGIGDMFVVRVAGNVIGRKTLGSIEYAVQVAGVKLVLVLGHTRCGAVTSTVKLIAESQDVDAATGCSHLHWIADEIEKSISDDDRERLRDLPADELEQVIEDVGRRNVQRTVDEIVARSEAVQQTIDQEQLMVIGAIYDVASGQIEFLETEAAISKMA